MKSKRVLSKTFPILSLCSKKVILMIVILIDDRNSAIQLSINCPPEEIKNKYGSAS